MGNGISTATRSRVAVCIAALSILIGFSSPAFAKGWFVRHKKEIFHAQLHWTLHEQKKCQDEENRWPMAEQSTYCQVTRHPWNWLQQHPWNWLKKHSSGSLASPSFR